MSDRARDFRLDANLREACKRDIEQFCFFEREAAPPHLGSRCAVIACLQDWRHHLRDEECRAAVRATLERGADDVRFTPVFQMVCEWDYHQHCAGVQPVRVSLYCSINVLELSTPQVIACLQDWRHELRDEECRERVCTTLEFGAIDIRCTPVFQFACEGDCHQHCGGLQAARGVLLLLGIAALVSV
jgi:putative component of toxin-antitoxin plasmid stabilization module